MLGVGIDVECHADLARLVIQRIYCLWVTTLNLCGTNKWYVVESRCAGELAWCEGRSMLVRWVAGEYNPDDLEFGCYKDWE